MKESTALGRGIEAATGDTEQARWVTLLDALSEGVIVRHEDSILYTNDTLRTLLAYEGSRDELNREPLERWIHEADRPIVERHYRKRLAGGGADNYEFRMVRVDGEIRWVDCRATLVDWNGVPAVVGCIYDITDQKQAAEAREKSEHLFHNVFRLTPEVMVLSSLRDGQVLDVNPSFLNVFGRRRDDVLGKTMETLELWADPTFHSRFVEELKMTASMTDVPATVRTRGKVIRHFRLFAQKIEHENEPMLLLIGRDVTDDLLQAQELQRSRDTAELANRAKSEFLANMSHELRTPLNAILGFAEILRDEMVGPIGNGRYVEYARDIHESGTHLLSIINDILDLSKVEAGRLEAYLTWIDPLEALEMCVTLVQQRAFEAGLRLEHQFDTTTLLEADERLIKQIALNLLSNAIKFTEPGGRVSVNLEKTGTGGLCLSVTDTGIGMTAEEIKIAKRPFGQVDSSLSRRHEGSGLGLPLISAFAEKLSATMTIDSQPGVGTRVSIVFPSFKVKEKEGT